MPYVPSTPTLTLCDQLVLVLTTAWAPSAPSGVERHYFKRIADADGGDLKLEGRRVVIYPTNYDNQVLDRGEDEYTHRVSVQVFERYADGGDPPVEWIDERVDFVFEQLVQGFDFAREQPSWNEFLRTLSANVTICNIGQLTTQSLFVSQVDFVFEEIRSA